MDDDERLRLPHACERALHLHTHMRSPFYCEVQGGEVLEVSFLLHYFFRSRDEKLRCEAPPRPAGCCGIPPAPAVDPAGCCWDRTILGM